MGFTQDHPATLSNVPRGMAMVMFAKRPRALVRTGGTEYKKVNTVAARASEKQRVFTDQARTRATTKNTAVNVLASASPMRPLGKGRAGLFTRSTPRS